MTTRCFRALLLCVSALFPIGVYGQSTKGIWKGWDEELGISKHEAIGSLSLFGALLFYRAMLLILRSRLVVYRLLSLSRFHREQLIYTAWPS